MSFPTQTRFLIIILVLAHTSATMAQNLEHPLSSVLAQFFEARKHPGTFGSTFKFDARSCHLAPDLKKEIQGYKEAVGKILDIILKGSFKGKAYDEVALFVDLFGHRIPGGDTMEKAVSFIGERMSGMGLSNLHEELAKIPTWSSGIEIGRMTNPVEMGLNIKAMGMSVETPSNGLSANILVVETFKELEDMKEKAKGRIVVFNSKIGDAHKQLIVGPSFAAKHGAVAVLCRSPIKLVYDLAVMYEPGIPKIPAAVISREDADKLQRMSKMEDDVTVHLLFTNQSHYERVSRNVIGDYPGTQLPNEYVMLMSHGGSWDVGEGAQDDALGVILDMLTVPVLQALGLKPKRTIRTAIFTAEESGLFGVTKWVADHHEELGSYSAALEADIGCMKATGFVISGSSEAACVLKEIMSLFENATKATLLSKMDVLPTNSMPVHGAGVPTISLNGDDENGEYFEIQHTFLDSMTAVNSDELDKCFAVLASTAYVLADLKEKLPRK